MTSVLLNVQDDPLAAALAPPAGESIADRQSRLQREQEAKLISDHIDEQLRLEREQLKKRRGAEVRLLLLGQSSSGKSTLQKQFQLLYAPSTLDLERSSWRPVVYMNLVKSIRTILDALESEYDIDYQGASETIMPVASSSRLPASPSKNHASGSSYTSRYMNGDERGADGGQFQPSSPNSPTDNSNIAQEFATLRMRLLPLLSMETELAKTIGHGVQVAPGKQEVFVRFGWQNVKQAAQKLTHRTNDSGGSPTESSSSSPPSPTTSRNEFQHQLAWREDMIRQVAKLLIVSKQYVKLLWEHPLVNAMTRKRRLRLEDSSTFFLDNLDRLAALDYVPTDDDILRARLRTMGVVEHHFEVASATSAKPIKWRLFDVGGARGQRPSWVPYFEDANAIIFLAPISAFDQYLEEDNRTNRVDDSLQLFTLICSNPLLKNVHLVLFLNKCDVLQKKLDMGVKVKKYITSFGDRANDYPTVSSYFRAHFTQVHRKNNVDSKRELYTHLTSVVDTAATRKIIFNVRDAIFRDHLKESSML